MHDDGELAAELDDIASDIVDSAIAVHRMFGPGLLESAYEGCLRFELMSRGYDVEKQKELPVVYRGNRIDCGYRLDLLVNGKVLVECKAVEKLIPIHEAQIITYLRLTDLRLGFLLNFNVRLMKDGIRRIANNFPIPS